MKITMTREQLDILIEETIDSGYKDRLDEGFKEEAGMMAFQAVLAMLATASGRKKLSDIILFIPNLIERICDAQFGDGEKGEIGNLKTKLCKLFGYGLTGPIGIVCKVVGKMILLIDNNAAQVIIDGSNKSMENNLKKLPPVKSDLPENPVPINAPMQPTPTTDPYLSESLISKSNIQGLIRESLAGYHKN